MVFTNWPGTWLGPLTTTWSMPDDCRVHVVNCATCDGGFAGQRCSIKDEKPAPYDHTSCWPPARKQAGTPKAPFLGWGFYSPGLACPTGYAAACTAEYDEARPEWAVQFTLVPGETAIGCCPEGFKCTNLNGNTCVAVDTVTVTTGMCSGTELVNLGPVTYPVFVDMTTTVSEETETGGRGTVALPTSQEVTLLAPMFQLNYRSSDLAPPTTSPPTMSTSLSESSASSGSSASTDSDSASSSPPPLTPATEEDGLSTGAIVGIGVGAALGGILLGVVAILFFMRNRKRKRAAEGWPETQPAELSPRDYKYTAEMPAVYPPNYTPVDRQPHYTGYESHPVELPSGPGSWAELPTGSGPGGWTRSSPQPASGL